MKTVKQILLGVLAFLAWIEISVSGERLRVPRGDFTAWLLIYPALLVASVIYLHWLFRAFLMPLSHLSSERREELKEQALAHYSKGFLAGTVGLGYIFLVSYVVGLLTGMPDGPQVPSMILPAVFLIALGTLAQVRGLVRHLSGGELKQPGRSHEHSTAPNGGPAASGASPGCGAGPPSVS
jgi:hypothetical protein